MKISQQKVSNKRWLIIILAIIFVAVAISAGIYALNKSKEGEKSSPSSSQNKSSDDSESKIDTNPPSSEEVDAGNSTKFNNASNASQTPPPDDTSKTLSITANNTGSTIQVQSTIAANVDNGNCSLVLTNGTKTVTENTVGIQALPGYSTCKGWNVDISKLGSGSWTATVTATYNSITNTATANFQI